MLFLLHLLLRILDIWFWVLLGVLILSVGSGDAEELLVDVVLIDCLVVLVIVILRSISKTLNISLIKIAS